jgi:hypothetical protein
MTSLHKRFNNDNKIVPEEGQPDLLCSNKESLGCPSLGVEENVLPEETIKAMIRLGGILRDIHNRLISEGYIINNGVIIKPDAKTKKPTE